MKTKKVKLDAALAGRAEEAAALAGYSGLEEFVAHAVEAAIEKIERAEDEKAGADQLKGLGYI